MQKAFKMKLYPGMAQEYKRRHDRLWPEMVEMIHAHSGRGSSIFLAEALWDEGADTDINRRWWDYMADIMDTNPDNSPVSVDLPLLFHLD